MKQPFEQVVTVHGPAVLRVCLAVLGPADAEDAWSETFLAALRAYADLDGDANVEAWLITIAHRKAIDLIRARNRRADPVDQLPDRPGTLGTPGGWDHELWDALAELPTRQRQAVAYHYLGGLPHKDVAAVIGGTTAAARRAAADGINALRRRYAAAAHPRGAA